MKKMETCLICGIARTNHDTESLKTEKESLLEKQLSIVFVLGKLLELPTESLEKCFQLAGGENPADWITICGGECQEIVENARIAYQEMRRARQKLMECQNKIQDKIRSAAPMSLSAAYHTRDSRAQIFWLIRETVIKKEYTPPVMHSEDFTAGDRMAEQLLTFTSTPLPVVAPKMEAELSSTLQDHQSELEIEVSATFPSVDIKPILQISEEPQSKVKCPDCDYLAKSKKSLWNHTAIAHPKDNTIFQCDLCDLSFNTRRLLSKHKWSKHQRCRRIKKINCPHCDYTTRGNTELKRHIAYKHTKAFRFFCDLCDKKFHQSGDLTRHQVYHHSKCTVKNCGKICESKWKLREHQVTFHGREVSLFKCPECEMLYREKKFLKAHLLTRHGKGNGEIYACEQCDKTYFAKLSLQDHIRKNHQKKTNVEQEGTLILGI